MFLCAFGAFVVQRKQPQRHEGTKQHGVIDAMKIGSTRE